MLLCVFFFFKQKTAYELRISDWSSDVCSSHLSSHAPRRSRRTPRGTRSERGDPRRCRTDRRRRSGRLGAPWAAVSSGGRAGQLVVQAPGLAEELGPPALHQLVGVAVVGVEVTPVVVLQLVPELAAEDRAATQPGEADRKGTRLNSSQ